MSKEEAKKFKPNGVRASKAETPESVTLSVDSLQGKVKDILCYSLWLNYSFICLDFIK